MADWRPHTGQQTKFCERGEDEVLFGGAAGPGKTECLIMLATRHVERPHYKGLLVRRSFPQLQEIMDRCWVHYPKLGGQYRATEKRWYFPSKATIDLGHMQHEDSKYNYQGKEFHFVGFDELTQFSETQYTYLISRVRSTDPDIPTRIRSTTNPGGIGHMWVKQRFIDPMGPEQRYRDPVTGMSRMFVPGLVQDNPSLFENDPNYVARLDALPEVERLRLRDGVWDAFEGQVFRELQTDYHACEPFDIPAEWTRFCVLDWGYAKPFSVHWYALDYDGVLYLYREWYGNKPGTIDEGLRMRADEVAQGILERERETINLRIADTSIWHNRPAFRLKEARGPTIIEDFNAAGLYFTKADRDREQGKLQVHNRLRRDEQIDTTTGEIVGHDVHFQAFSSCEMFWQTMPALTEDPKKPDDVDTTGPDHAYDCLRYMCMARPAAPRKVVKMPSGTFRHEREKLIKAKKYARRHGITVAQAYGKVR